ncbi:MAG: lysophospholipid acyltransferase family protein [Acidobacteriota bacterium]
MKKLFYYTLRFIGFIIGKTFFHLKVEGKEHIPKYGPYIIVANHLSYLDPVAVHGVSRRQLSFFMLAEWYYDRRHRWFYDIFGCIPLKKGGANPEAFERAIKVINQGDPFVIFPEGGVSRTGKIMTWQPGVGLLALRTGAPVIPVIIRGTSEVLPAGSSELKVHPVSVYAGPPLSFNVKKRGTTTRSEVQEATRKIRDAFIALAKEKGLYNEIVGPEVEKEKIIEDEEDVED